MPHFLQEVNVLKEELSLLVPAAEADAPMVILQDELERAFLAGTHSLSKDYISKKSLPKIMEMTLLREDFQKLSKKQQIFYMLVLSVMFDTMYDDPKVIEVIARGAIRRTKAKEFTVEQLDSMSENYARAEKVTEINSILHGIGGDIMEEFVELYEDFIGTMGDILETIATAEGAEKVMNFIEQYLSSSKHKSAQYFEIGLYTCLAFVLDRTLIKKIYIAKTEEAARIAYFKK